MNPAPQVGRLKKLEGGGSEEIGGTWLEKYPTILAFWSCWRNRHNRRHGRIVCSR